MFKRSNDLCVALERDLPVPRKVVITSSWPTFWPRPSSPLDSVPLLAQSRQRLTDTASIRVVAPAASNAFRAKRRIGEAFFQWRRDRTAISAHRALRETVAALNDRQIAIAASAGAYLIKREKSA